MNNHFKTIIVGGGPAGASCGYVLKKHDEDCLIIDCAEFPREKLCGGGLTPKAHVLINEIFDGVKYDYVSCKIINIYANNQFVCDFELDNDIRIVSRKAFDSVLLSHYIKLGGRNITGRVSKVEEDKGVINVCLRNGERFTCDYLVAADGANSIVRKCLHPRGKGVFLLEKTILGTPSKELNLFFDNRVNKGYMYEFPNPEGYVVGAGGDSDKDISLNTFDEMLSDYGYEVTEKSKGAFIPMYDKQDYPFKKNILFAGDAGGYVDSVSGEGLYLAAKSGQNAALSIINGSDYESLNAGLIKLVKRRQLLGHIFYYKLTNKLFMYVLRKKMFNSFITKRIDRVLSHQY